MRVFLIHDRQIKPPCITRHQFDPQAPTERSVDALGIPHRQLARHLHAVSEAESHVSRLGGRTCRQHEEETRQNGTLNCAHGVNGIIRSITVRPATQEFIIPGHFLAE
jgi:hypothetical protein